MHAVHPVQYVLQLLSVPRPVMDRQSCPALLVDEPSNVVVGQ
jgi:hypothetical protein